MIDINGATLAGPLNVQTANTPITSMRSAQRTPTDLRVLFAVVLVGFVLALALAVFLGWVLARRVMAPVVRHSLPGLLPWPVARVLDGLYHPDRVLQ